MCEDEIPPLDNRVITYDGRAEVLGVNTFFSFAQGNGGGACASKKQGLHRDW